MPLSRITATCLLVTGLATATPAFAQDVPSSPAPESKQLKLKLPLDPILFGASALGLGLPEIFKNSLAPTQCRVCERDANGNITVNAFDRTIRSGLVGAFGVSPPAWSTASNVMIAGVLPVASIAEQILIANGGHFDRNVPIDIGIVGESVLVAAALDEAAKFIVGRQRPFVAYNSPYSDQLRAGTTNDDNVSFYSGHSSAAMAMTVAMSRVIQLRTGKYLGYYTLVPLGILTSLMRIAADKHWATDVLTGMAVGTVTGLLLPTFHE